MLKIACTGSSESTLVKMPHSWKSQYAAGISVVVNSLCVVAPIESGIF